jgi:hypothetical protein
VRLVGQTADFPERYDFIELGEKLDRHIANS